jgi:hypothetical protein
MSTSVFGMLGLGLLALLGLAALVAGVVILVRVLTRPRGGNKA